MDPNSVEEPAEPKLTLEERVAALEATVIVLESKLLPIEEATKVVKTPLQLVVEKEGNEFKARRKILIQTATETKEGWEDATEEFTQKELEEKLNGA